MRERARRSERKRNRQKVAETGERQRDRKREKKKLAER